MTEVYGLLTMEEKNAMVGVVMADSHASERKNIMKAVLGDEKIMNTIAWLPLSLPSNIA